MLLLFSEIHINFFVLKKLKFKMSSKKMQNVIMNAELTTKCINSIRVLAADTVEKAKSGHPGAPMGCAPIAHVLFSEVMNYNSSNPKWSNRDRFVLSNGHACALQYSMMHLAGYSSVSLDDLKQFRQLNSKTPGHPENTITAGVEVATGPLGQGLCNAVGMAITESHLAAEFNTVCVAKILSVNIVYIIAYFLSTLMHV